jgi:hypothetical protein
MTYAHHQEAASRAMLRLLSADHAMQGADGAVILQCREHAVAALAERLDHLGGLQHGAPKLRTVHVSSLSKQPVRHLSGLLKELHRSGPGATAPSDLLPGPPADTARDPVDLWRCIARELMLANHELSAATRQPWTHKPEAGWYVLADTATAAEALVLDDRLGREGLLPRVPSDGVLARRLVAGDVARMAGWYGTDNSADLAAQSVNATLGLGGGPRIYMVRRPEDLADAQRALAGFLRPHLGDAGPGSADDQPGLLAARALAVGQIRLAEAFSRRADAHGGAGAALADEFRARVPAYRDLHQSTLRLVEVETRRSPLILAQQSEMVMQLRCLRSDRLTRASLLDLNEATHEVAVNLGKALRREGMHRKNILTLESESIGLPQPKPITNSRHVFQVACTRLARADPPAASATSWCAPVERQRLRMALEATPTGRPRGAHGRSVTCRPRPLAPQPRASASAVELRVPRPGTSGSVSGHGSQSNGLA